MQRKNPGTKEITLTLDSTVFSRSNTKELSTMSALMLTVEMMGIVIFGVQLKSTKIEKLLKVAEIGENAMIIAVDMVFEN